MSRCIHSCRCKWLINIIEVVQFKMTVASQTVRRSKTKQVIWSSTVTLWWRFVTKTFFYWWLYSFFCWCCCCQVWCCKSCWCCCFCFRSCCCRSRSFCSCCCCHDSGVAWYFLEIFADNFDDLDDVVEFAVCRLHLRFLVDLAVFLFSHSL